MHNLNLYWWHQSAILCLSGNNIAFYLSCSEDWVNFRGFRLAFSTMTAFTAQVMDPLWGLFLLVGVNINSNYKLREWRETIGWVCRLSELSMSQTFARSLFIPSIQKTLAGRVVLLPCRTGTGIILVVAFNWQLDSLRRGSLPYLVAWCCSMWPFSVSEASLGFLASWVDCVYLNLDLHSLTSATLFWSEKITAGTQIRGEGTQIPIFDKGVVTFHWKTAYGVRNIIVATLRNSLLYHYSICYLPEFYRPFLFAVVSSFKLFILKKKCLKKPFHSFSRATRGH